MKSAPRLLRWEAPGPYVVAFSTREGGVSEDAYASLNVGLLTADARGRVEENRRRLFAAVGADCERVSWPRQVHGATILRCGSRGLEGDGMWADEPHEAVLVVTADCVPIALARLDGQRPAVALAHVGWRGLLAGVVDEAVARLEGGSVAAAIGPGIGPCCYDVGDDVAGPVQATFGAGLVRDGKLDLPGAVEHALRRAGCATVERIGGCTACTPERYFSHRRDGGVTGRQAAIAYVAR